MIGIIHGLFSFSIYLLYGMYCSGIKYLIIDHLTKTSNKEHIVEFCFAIFGQIMSLLTVLSYLFSSFCFFFANKKQE